MQRLRLTRALAAVCLTAAALTGCGGNDDGGKAPTDSVTTPTPQPETPQAVDKRCAP